MFDPTPETFGAYRRIERSGFTNSHGDHKEHDKQCCARHSLYDQVYHKIGKRWKRWN